MGLMNLIRIKGKSYLITDKPKMTKREALSKIHAMLCCIDDGEPFAVQQKFAKYNVNKLSDEQVKEKFNTIVSLVNQLK